MSIFQRNLDIPILFSQLYVNPQVNERNQDNVINKNGNHIVVLVHGYQGSQFDLKQWKNNLNIMYPELLILSSSCNEGILTEGDIVEMGLRLAREVIEFITDWCIQTGLRKLTFIGHSLGGLIIRAALPKLVQYQSYMSTIITLGTPHLGTMHNKNKLIDTGLWFLKKIKNSQSLEQLSMNDQQNYKQSFLYKLSCESVIIYYSFNNYIFTQQGFQWFENIVLVSSSQDQYVPFESARIQLYPDQDKQQLESELKTYEKIVSNIMNQKNISNKLYRMNVIFPNQGLFDNILGRQCHILFLDSIQFIKIFLACYMDFFQ